VFSRWSDAAECPDERLIAHRLRSSFFAGGHRRHARNARLRQARRASGTVTAAGKP
jgi:hypothetical protein